MFGVEDEMYVNGQKVGAQRWKRAAKLLFQALQKSRKRVRRLQCRLDDQYEASRDELMRLRSDRDKLLYENTRLVTEMLGMREEK